MKKAIIYGITGQDGFYLTQELLRHNYEVIGVARRSSIDNTARLNPFFTNKNFKVIEGDITDGLSIVNTINHYQPDEIYNLAAQSVTEESLLPIKSGNLVKYITFKELWDNQIKKSKTIRTENFNGTEIEVIDINPTENSICALGYSNSSGNWYNITQISRHKWNGKIAKLSQKFGSVCVTPNHSLIDIYGKVVQPSSNPWMLNIRKVNSIVKKPIDCISTKMTGVKNSVWLHKKENGRIGYVKESIDNVDALCRFVGAFVAEGHTCFNTANNTYTVNISEQNKEWLISLQDDLNTFFDGRSCIITHKKDGYDDVYTLEIKSRYLYDLMRYWCGEDSYSKKLPDWFTRLSKKHASILFNKMIEGDGCFQDESWRYTTSSYKLACQFSWLVTYLGYDYTVNEEDNNHSYWHFRSCSFYQLNQGSEGKKISWIDYNGYVYDITVDEVHNFTVGVGNIVVHNSHVATSFNQPGLTWDVTAKGCLNILEAIRNIKPDTKFYQASSSEMFGKNYSTSIALSMFGPDVINKYQNEDTPMMPQSPYAIAKLAAHHLIRNYRDSYGLFACSGILFNHETLSYGTPIIIKKDNKIDILPIGDVARFHTGVVFDMSNLKYQDGKPCTDLKVWDQSGWVDISWVSGYPHEKDKNPRIINARNFVYTATGSHPCIMEDDSEKNTSDLELGDKVKNISYPNIELIQDVSLEEAEWLGMMVGDGNLHHNTPRFTNKDISTKQKFKDLWISFTKNGRCEDHDSYSGFNGEYVGQIKCYSDSIIDCDIYTNDISPFGHKNKKVPQKILNSSKDVMEAFLIGYNICDGLKKNSCTYKFKNFKTNSPTLAAGLLFLVSKVTGQEYNITVEESWEHGKQQFYYSINLLSDKKSAIHKYNIVKECLRLNVSIRQIAKTTGISRKFIQKIKNGYIPEDTHVLKKCANEIKKIIEIPNYDGWFFDLETSSGTFHAGIGQGVVHNSPMRGDKFVTKKITKWIGGFVAASQGIDLNSLSFTENDILYNGVKVFPKLRLGNLEAKRDWGHAADYVKAMYLMLQQNTPDDYVVSTQETHSVKDFLKLAFNIAHLGDYQNYIVIDSEFYRPAEVDYLLGDSSKARKVLGWTPSYSFESLVEEMVEYDIHESEKARFGIEAISSR